ncbi:hypothetical protein [Actinomadura sp. KC06]|nr:hypothetical protein [Actinomadura sp. KC06]
MRVDELLTEIEPLPFKERCGPAPLISSVSYGPSIPDPNPTRPLLS